MVDNLGCSPALEPVPNPDFAPPANPDPASISPDAWDPLEAAAGAVVCRIQPNRPSENRRAAVIDYVQRIIGSTVGCQVFPFGSVPLKTYLPDGDIDLTAFGHPNDEILAKHVQAVLESQEARKDAEFEVKDVQYIHAEVKLVKCIVQNIIVDISFNQFGGLCTLCFLEQVDRKFEKNHLFKRSIMLIKAWCYYESRILGAHHGLISTYALEILVLYIFHLFHETLDGPLAVLYRFLDYYSKFDWDNKGISLFGPVSLSSLPDLVTDSPDTVDDDFTMREEFLKECAQFFTVTPRNSERNTRSFSRKFFNIVDPLKQSNNLGRSVSKGNFLRIRSAFDFGARKLGKILQVPVSSTVDEVNQFFRNTLRRHCTRVRPDVQEIILDFNAETERADNDCSPLYNNNSFGDLSDQFNNISISDSSNHGSLKQKGWNYMAEYKESKTTNPETSISTGGSDSCEPVPPLITGACSLPSEEGHGAPDLFNESENGMKAGIKHDTNSSHNGTSTTGYTGRSHQSFEEVDDDDEGSNWSDLTGDYETNRNNLLYAQGFHQDYPMNPYYPFGPVYYQMPSPPPARYQNRRSSNGHSRNNAYGYAGTNGIGPAPCPPGYIMMRPSYSQIDDPNRVRGTGTYFPNPSLCKDRSPTGRGGRRKTHFLPHNHQRSQQYGRSDVSADLSSIPSEELRQIYVSGANDLGISSSLNIPVPSPSSEAPREIAHGNGYIQPPDKKLEFGTLGALPFEVTSEDHGIGNRLNYDSNSQPSASASPMSLAHNPGIGSDRMRNAQPYHLKDNGDFPPLSS
uniref:PAP-associated domain-containing protein n=1 Tax=Leersia perrieri TaxID=77586 RepID=A0A0D9XNC9_9ORYZ